MNSIWHPALFIWKRTRNNQPHTYLLLIRKHTCDDIMQLYTFRGGEYRFKKRHGRTYLQITKALFKRDKQFFRRFETYQNRVDSMPAFSRNGTGKGRKQEVRP